LRRIHIKEAADSIERGVKKVLPEAVVVKVPMADGGEGTVQSRVDATRGQIIRTWVKGPLLSEVEAFYGIFGDNETEVIEMAADSGLPLVPKEQRNLMITTTYGTGEF
jgi:glycerate 2-kinase